MGAVYQDKEQKGTTRLNKPIPNRTKEDKEIGYIKKVSPEEVQNMKDLQEEYLENNEVTKC